MVVEGGEIKTAAYWRPEITRTEFSEQEAAEKLIELLDLWEFAPGLKEQIIGLIRDRADELKGPHLFRYYNPRPSKVAAAEQALYGRTLTKADKSFDVKYFVDQILSEKTAIMQWLIESGEEDMAFMPVLQTLQQLTSYGEEVAVA